MPAVTSARRQFLQMMMAFGVTPTFSRGANLKSRRIKAGFLGGAHSHALEKWKILTQSDAFELVGMAEEDEAVRSRFAPLGARFDTAASIVSQSEVVVIESAVADHARHALLALEAKRHIHLEKPAADNLPDFAKAVRLARAQGCLIQVGYMWRYHPGFAKIFEAVAQGILGEVYLVRGTINNQLDAKQRPEWGKFAGGTMFELGSHLIDAMVRLLGAPTAVKSSLRTDGSDEDNFRDNCVSLFQFPTSQGTVFSATLQPNAGKHRSFEVLGTKGTARLCPIEPPTLVIDLAEAAGPYPAGVTTVELPAYRRYVGDFEALARAVRGDAPLPVDLDTELTVHEAVLKASEMD